MNLPGWLLHRARTSGFARVHVLLPPAGEKSSYHAIYLLERGAAGGDHQTAYELHAVDDAASGIDGCTIALTRNEAYRLLSAFAGAFTGRTPGEEVTPLAGVSIVVEPSCGAHGPDDLQCELSKGHDGDHGAWDRTPVKPLRFSWKSAAQKPEPVS